MKKTINSEIDSRIVDMYWENLKNLESYIDKEISKAWYIIWLQWTILFIAAMKLWNIDNVTVKIIIIFLFLLSWFLSYLTIKSDWKLKHIGFLNPTIFDRWEVIDKIQKMYIDTKKIYNRKISLNKKNTLLQGITLLLVLIALLFPNIL